ncbi:MAG: hypothetical protein AAGK00_14675 [Pseudomonadota bacterium]
MKKLFLTAAADRAAFDAKFAERTANPLPKTYLDQCQVYGFAIGGELVGGYLVNMHAPFRYTDMLPPAYRDTPHTRHFLAEGRTVELGCMWLDQRRINNLRRTRIYLSAVVDAMRIGRGWIVAGSVSEKIARIHKIGFRQMIYAGPTTFPGAPYGEIYAARAHELAVRFPAGLAFRVGYDYRRETPA